MSYAQSAVCGCRIRFVAPRINHVMKVCVLGSSELWFLTRLHADTPTAPRALRTSVLFIALSDVFCVFEQWTPVSWQTWENYNVTSGPYAHADGPSGATHLTAVSGDSTSKVQCP